MRAPLAFVLLAACITVSGPVGPEEGDRLPGTEGRVEGSLAYGAVDPIVFRSGVAYADERNSTVRLVTWEGASCEGSHSFGWEHVPEDGWQLSIDHDGAGQVDGSVWLSKCTVGGPSGTENIRECRGEHQVEVDLSLWSYEATRGGAVWGAAAVTSESGILKGGVEFDLTFCGRSRVGSGPTTTVFRGPSGSGRSVSTAQLPEGWRHLRPRLDACGHDPEDPLRAWVSAPLTGAPPWEVQVSEATPGSEACLQEVLSDAPLDARFDPRGQMFAATFHPKWFDGPATVRPERARRRCRRMVEAAEEITVDPSPLDEVTCGAEAPLTALELVFRNGALDAVATEPPVPCVEALARQRLAMLPEAWGAATDDVRCLFDLPLPRN